MACNHSRSSSSNTTPQSHHQDGHEKEKATSTMPAFNEHRHGDKGQGKGDTSKDSHIIPESFYCPLTLQVMVDPVLDCEGNTYERQGIERWLDYHRTSPLSREPLYPAWLVPNMALRYVIYQHMGPAWVAQHQDKSPPSSWRVGTATFPPTASPPSAESASSPPSAASASNPPENAKKLLFERIDSYLATCTRITGTQLKLDKDGLCAFPFEDGITIIIEVAYSSLGSNSISSSRTGFFLLHAKKTMPTALMAQDVVKDTLLELNYRQVETRGGSLSP